MTERKRVAPDWEERNEYQKIKIKDTKRLYSLKRAAELAGVSYKTAWTYTQTDDPEIKRQIQSCMRFPDQTGKSRILYTQDAIRILKKIRDRNRKIRARGRKRKGWKWSDESKRRQSESKKRWWRKKKLEEQSNG